MKAQLEDTQTLLTLSELALHEAKALGADQAEVDIAANAGYEVTVRKGDVETIEYNRDHSLGVTVYRNKRKGSSSVSDLNEQSIKDAVRAAVAIARYTSQDQHAGLCDANLLATDIPDLQLSQDWAIEMDDAIELGIACEQTMYETKKITNTEGASVATGKRILCYANSHGFAQAYPLTSHSISVLAIASEDGEMKRDYWYTVDRHPERLEGYQEVARKAAQRAVRRLGARKPATAKVPVLFEAPLAKGLIGTFISAIGGPLLYNKTSFLYDCLGKQVFPKSMRIYEKPHLPAAMGSAPFDGEGVLTRANTIVADGVLENYVLDSYAARKLGLQTTANAGGVHNLQVAFEGEQSQEEMLATMGRGLLVTELIGHGINLVTGDYSRGVAGFWVEEGAIQYPVEQLTIAGNLADMFQSLVKIGNDIDRRSTIHSGSILIEEMTLASG